MCGALQPLKAVAAGEDGQQRYVGAAREATSARRTTQARGCSKEMAMTGAVVVRWAMVCREDGDGVGRRCVLSLRERRRGMRERRWAGPTQKRKGLEENGPVHWKNKEKRKVGHELLTGEGKSPD
jgi:hypothetical protein